MKDVDLCSPSAATSEQLLSGTVQLVSVLSVTLSRALSLGSGSGIKLRIRGADVGKREAVVRPLVSSRSDKLEA